MLRVVFCNGKGGTGKTTVCMLIAMALAKAGRRVGVLDLDPQGTAADWIRASGGMDGGLELCGGNTSEKDVLLVDTPPRHETLSKNAAKGDVVIVVASPSPNDLLATRRCAESVDGRMTRLLFNNVKKGTTLASHLKELSGKVGVETLKSVVHNRQCYQYAALNGWRALTPDAREEILNAAVEMVSLKL